MRSARGCRETMSAFRGLLTNMFGFDFSTRTTITRVRFSVCTADNRVRASISSTRRALDRLNALGVAKNVVGVVLRLDLP
jgi:hypothetical protein